LSQKHPGHPHERRTAWKCAEEDVQDAQVANADSMGRSRALHSTLVSEGSSNLAPSTSVLTLPVVSPSTKKGRKKPREETKCTTKTKWSREEMGRPIKSFDGKYKELKEECKQHGISQSGTTKAKIERLREHYAEPHVDASRRAKTMPISDFFKQN
jgi:hypothetical protein